MHKTKQSTTLRITTYSLIALACICGPIISEAQEADYEMVKLEVKEISEKAGNYGCAPAAAVNVLGWWSTNNRNLFPTSDAPSDLSAQDVQKLLISLSANMRTDATGGTSGLTIASGIRKTLKEYKVDGTASTWPCTWAWAKREIDAGRPFIAGGSPPIVGRDSAYFDHFVCVIGYVIYPYSEDEDQKYALLYHDGYGEGETEFYPADEAREEYWLSGPWDNYRYNPVWMYTIEIKEDKDPCDASAYIDITVSEPEIKDQSGGIYCEADVTVKNTGPQKIWIGRYAEFSQRWACAGGMAFCQATEPGGEELQYNGFSSTTDNSGECTETHTSQYIALKDTPQCKDMFDEIRATGVIPAGITITEIDPGVCDCP